MKVILLQDVPKVGRKHEVKDVADGFARNFLIARGKASPATAAILEKIKAATAAGEAHADIALAQFKALTKELEEKPLVIKAKANDQGHLFAGITATQLAETISQTYRAPIDPKAVELLEPLKSIGKHKVILNHNKITAEVAVVVEAL